MRGLATVRTLKIFIFSFCFGFALKAEERENKLTIFVYPSSNRLSWESPKMLLRDSLGMLTIRALSTGPSISFKSGWDEPSEMNSFYTSGMGHTIVNVTCELPTGETFDRWTSYSGQEYPELDKKIIFQEKKALAALFYDYLDGYVIKGEENFLRLTYYKNPHGWAPRYLSFPLSRDGCQNVRDMILFFESFHFPKGISLAELENRGEDNLLYFTANFEPFESYQSRLKNGHGKVGGGCSSYAVGLLKAAGIFDSIFDQAWRRPVKISERLMGGDIDQETSETKKISIFEILLGELGDHWEYDGFQNRELNLYDPRLIWSFIGEVSSCLKSSSDPNCSAAALQWLANKPQPPQIGRPMVFEHSIEVGTMERTGHLDSKPPFRIETARQKISGVRVVDRE